MEGQHVVLEPVDWPRHGPALYASFGRREDEALWRWILFGPYDSEAEFIAQMAARMEEIKGVPYLIRVKETGAVEGMFCYLRVRPMQGSAEIGAVIFSPRLQRTPAATEAVYLFGRHLMDECDYRRYEWKCNSSNTASRRAGERFGFVYEGTFRNDFVVYKEDAWENRDTDWLTIIDTEWPDVRRAFEAWLAPMNFDENGQQLISLRDFQKQFKISA